MFFSTSFSAQVMPTEEDLTGLKEDFPPFILMVGELPNYDDIFIVAEGEKLLKVTGGHLVAVKCLISFYYTFVIQRPVQIHSCFFRNTFDNSLIPKKTLSKLQFLLRN